MEALAAPPVALDRAIGAWDGHRIVYAHTAGYTDGRVPDAGFAYSPGSDSWTDLGAAPANGNVASMVDVDDVVHVAWLSSPSGGSIVRAERLSDADAWTRAAPDLTEARGVFMCSPGAVAARRDVVVACGGSNQALSSTSLLAAGARFHVLQRRFVRHTGPVGHFCPHRTWTICPIVVRGLRPIAWSVGS